MTAKTIARTAAKRDRAEEHALTLLRFRELTAAWIQMEADLRARIDALQDRVDALERPWWRKVADAAVDLYAQYWVWRHRFR